MIINFILMVFLSLFNPGEEVSFKSEQIKNFKIITIKIENDTQDTIILTPSKLYSFGYNGSCEKGYLDFIYSESGINLDNEKIHLDDVNAMKPDSLYPGEIKVESFSYNPKSIKQCKFVYRYFNINSKTGTKYILNLENLNVSTEKISNYLE